MFKKVSAIQIILMILCALLAFGGVMSAMTEEVPGSSLLSVDVNDGEELLYNIAFIRHRFTGDIPGPLIAMNYEVANKLEFVDGYTYFINHPIHMIALGIGDLLLPGDGEAIERQYKQYYEEAAVVALYYLCEGQLTEAEETLDKLNVWKKWIDAAQFGKALYDMVMVKNIETIELGELVEEETIAKLPQKLQDFVRDQNIILDVDNWENLLYADGSEITDALFNSVEDVIDAAIANAYRNAILENLEEEIENLLVDGGNNAEYNLFFSNVLTKMRSEREEYLKKAVIKISTDIIDGVTHPAISTYVSFIANGEYSWAKYGEALGQLTTKFIVDYWFPAKICQCAFNTFKNGIQNCIGINELGVHMRGYALSFFAVDSALVELRECIDGIPDMATEEQLRELYQAYDLYAKVVSRTLSLGGKLITTMHEKYLSDLLFGGGNEVERWQVELHEARERLNQNRQVILEWFVNNCPAAMQDNTPEPDPEDPPEDEPEEEPNAILDVTYLGDKSAFDRIYGYQVSSTEYFKYSTVTDSDGEITGATITGIQNDPTNLVVPAILEVAITDKDGEEETKVVPVIGISTRAFQNNTTLKKITINLPSIDLPEGMFQGCSSLVCADLGNTKMSTVPRKMFYGCTALECVKLPKGVYGIGASAFEGCKGLAELILPNGITSIGEYAFRYCSSLEELYIPDSVNEIAIVSSIRGPFDNCTGLKKISIGGVPTLEACMLRTNSQQLEELIIRGTVQTIGKDALNSSYGEQNAYKTNGYHYTTSSARLVIEEGVEVIEEGAFEGCDIFTEIILPDSLTVIGNMAFKDCDRITDLSIPKESRCTAIGAEAFSSCAELSTVKLAGDIATIEAKAFKDCANLKCIDFGKKLKTIGEYAFRYCSSLEELYIPDSVEEIVVNTTRGPFDGCTGLKKISVGGISTLESSMLRTNSQQLEELIIRGTVGTIGKDALNSSYGEQNAYKTNGYHYTTSSARLIIEEGVKEIDESAFENCDIFVEAILPDSITSIGNKAFAGCDRMKAIANCYSYACKWCKSNSVKTEPIHGDERIIHEVVEPTCVATGLTEGVECAACSEMIQEQEVIPTKDHDIVTDTAVPPTCTESGLTEGRYCSVCKEIFAYQTMVPATGHKAVAVPGVSPTCTAAGLSEGSNCEVCGETITSQVEIPASGHTEETVDGKPATCTETGLSDGIVCAVCGEIVAAQEEMPALGHTGEIIEAQEPTCTVDGLTEGKKCAVCGEILAVQETIPSKGHTVVTDAAVEPTCTETGLTKGKYCSACGEILEPQTIVPATGHKPTAGNGVPPTCTTPGWTAESKCEVCSEIIEAKEEIPALGHTPEVIAGRDATCTDDGLTEGAKCSVCGETLTAQEIVPAKGHEIVVNAAVKPTCTETGLTEGKYCSVCNEVLEPQTVVSAAGHKLTEGNGVPPTCTTPGWTAESKCEVCGETIEAKKEIPAFGHTPEVLAGRDATCTDDGLTEGAKCSTCGEILTAQEVIPAKGHETIVDEAVKPTCTETGLTEGIYCSVCGEVLEPQTVVPATGHKPTAGNGVPPTCTTPGWTAESKCEICGETIEAKDEIPALGHKTEIIEGKDATCTVDGLTDGEKCSVCGEILTAQEITPALGHHEVVLSAIPATHITPGLSEGISCSRCGEILVSQVEIPAVDVIKTYLPIGMTFVGKYAFANTAVECVIISENCKRVEAYAFAGNEALKFVEIPASVEYIDSTAFADCAVDLIIVTASESHAHMFALEKGIAFVLIGE